MAPMGSLRIPSHLMVLRIRIVGRTWRRRGITTVGPVTTKTAPINTASISSSSRISQAAKEASTQVTRAPIVTRLRTTPPISRSSRRLRLSPPSNKISATEIEMKGVNTLPISSSGCSTENTGPAAMPATSKSRIDGKCRRHAIHRAANPNTTTKASSNR